MLSDIVEAIRYELRDEVRSHDYYRGAMAELTKLFGVEHQTFIPMPGSPERDAFDAGRMRGAALYELLKPPY